MSESFYWIISTTLVLTANGVQYEDHWCASHKYYLKGGSTNWTPNKRIFRAMLDEQLRDKTIN